MYGLSDDICELNDEVKTLKAEVKSLKKQLRNVKTLAKLALDNPKNDAAQNAVKIALDTIEYL